MIHTQMNLNLAGKDEWKISVSSFDRFICLNFIYHDDRVTIVLNESQSDMTAVRLEQMLQDIEINRIGGTNERKPN